MEELGGSEQLTAERRWNQVSSKARVYYKRQLIFIILTYGPKKPITFIFFSMFGSLAKIGHK